MAFIEKNISELNFNPFTKIGTDWFLLTSGDENGYNTMTASWGGMGFIWRKNVFTTVVRPTRHTYDYMEKNDLFTVSFYSEKERPALNFCGSHSGRDFDKAKETGLTPYFIEGTTAFEEAEMIFICKKLYSQSMDENGFYDKSCFAQYNGEALHKTYVGEIIKVYVKE